MVIPIHGDLAPQRQERLREFIRGRGVVRVDEIISELGVSPATARRDLDALEQTGRIKRVHGGAMSIETRLDEPLFDAKTSLHAKEKQRIAKAAAEMIHAGETVFLDGGSTVLELARLLVDRQDITVVTNSLRAAIELSGRGPQLVIVGGELRRRSQTVVGAFTRLLLEQVHITKAFMGTMGLSLDEGITTSDPSEAYTKELVAAKADKVILLTDSSKIGKSSFAKAGRLDDVDMVITDSAVEAKLERELRKAHKQLQVMKV